MSLVSIVLVFKSIGKIALATNMVMLPAIPIGGYGLFILMFIILKPDMRVVFKF